MAKIFYYDSVGLLDLSSGSVTAGAYSGGNFSVSAGNVTNEHYIYDQSLLYNYVDLWLQLMGNSINISMQLSIMQ